MDLLSHISPSFTSMTQNVVGSFAEMPSRQKLLTVLLFICLAELVCSVGLQGYVLDNWFMISTGNSIIESGIPYQNPFAPSDIDLGIVVQQWLYCVLFAGAYDVFGWGGIGALHFILSLVAITSMFFIISAIRPQISLTSKLAVVVACAFCGITVWVWRPHVITIAIMCFIIGLMECYRRDPQSKYLVIIPALVLLHVNLHASLAPIDIGILICYALPVPVCDKSLFCLSDYPKKWIVLVAVCSALALLITPYGIDNLLYSFNALSSLTTGGAVVAEMASVFSWRGNPFVIVIVCFSVVTTLLLLVNIKKHKSVDLPSLLLWIVAVIASWMAARNVLLLSIAGIPMLANLLNNVSSPSEVKVTRGIVIYGVIISIIVFFLAMSTLPQTSEEGADSSYAIGTPQINALSTKGTERDSRETPVEALDVLLTEGANPGDNVITFLDSGGYISTFGYRISEDSRPELWDANSITKNENYTWHRDFVAAIQSKTESEAKSIAQEKMLTAASFDWAIVWNGYTFFTDALTDSPEWKCIYKGEYNSAWKHLS